MLTVAVLFTVSSCENTILDIVSNPMESDMLQVDLGVGLKLLQSNMTLFVHPGNHVVPNFTVIQDLTGVIIQGLGSAKDINITCPPTIGLAFFKVSNLQIRNVTINGCGLSDHHWDEINETLYDTFNMSLKIPRAVKVGILLAACRDVTLANLVVMKTRGIGLLAISLLGSARLRNVHFKSNTSPQCSPTLDNFIYYDYHSWIGGGAYFLYQDFKETVETENHLLSIAGSQFTNNRDCSITIMLENYIERSPGLADLGYEIGAGGGLSVMMAQLEYTVSMNVMNSEFRENVARSGGGVHVGLFSGTPPPTSILLQGCKFINNGRDEIVSIGGGLLINIDLVHPSDLQNEQEIEDVEKNISINILDSMFADNNANTGGGAAIISNYAEQHAFDSSYQATFHKCVFRRNHGFGGAALLVYEKKESGFDNGLQLYIAESIFERNAIDLMSNIEVGHVLDFGAVHVRNINLTLFGSNRFFRNSATGLGAMSSLINVRGHLRFHRNRGGIGGAMTLIENSLLIPKQDTRIVFEGNRADLLGGAIYVLMTPTNFTFIADDCFLYFNEPAYWLCRNDANCLPNNVSIIFRSNKAMIGGAVFGTSLETCPWLTYFKEDMTYSYNYNQSVYENLHRSGRVFHFDQVPNNPRLVSSETARLRVNKDLQISVMPGERFHVDISAVDVFNKQIPEVITSAVVGEGRDDNSTSVIGDFGFFTVQPNSTETAPIAVYSEENTNITVRLTTIDFQTEVLLTVTLTDCILGFVHNELECVCDGRLASHDVSCDTNTHFTVDQRLWLGPIHESTNATNDDLTVTSCVLNYCKTGATKMRSGEWESQCADGFHRSGLLCGRCEDGYSVQLGTNVCAKCTNWYLFLLVLFIIIGIFVVFAVTLLQVSVAEGFFVSILFYSNIITLYAVYFDTTRKVTGIYCFTSFLTFNFGIDSCFYDGMDSLALISLQLAFVGYISILTIILIVSAKYMKLPQWLDNLNQKYSPSKRIATFIIMSYVSIVQASFGILSFIVVTTFDNEVHIRWYIDPTVPYFQGLHALLAVVALILVFLFILPLAIFLTFFSRAIYRWRYFNKLKPMYDALYAPFKLQYRPWLGFQLIIRIVLFIFAYFVPTPHQIFTLGVCLLIYFYMHTICQPYISKWANILESTLTGIAILYVIVTLYFGNFSSVENWAVFLSVATLATISYCIFIAAFVVYIFHRNPKLSKTVREIVSNILKRYKSVEPPNTIQPEIKVTDSIGNEVAHEINDVDKNRNISTASLDKLSVNISEQERNLEVSFTEYREPLLDEGELDVMTAYNVVISQRRTSSPIHTTSETTT